MKKKLLNVLPDEVSVDSKILQLKQLNCSVFRTVVKCFSVYWVVVLSLEPKDSSSENEDNWRRDGFRNFQLVISIYCSKPTVNNRFYRRKISLQEVTNSCKIKKKDFLNLISSQLLSLSTKLHSLQHLDKYISPLIEKEFKTGTSKFKTVNNIKEGALNKFYVTPLETAYMEPESYKESQEENVDFSTYEKIYLKDSNAGKDTLNYRLTRSGLEFEVLMHDYTGLKNSWVRFFKPRILSSIISSNDSEDLIRLVKLTLPPNSISSQGTKLVKPCEKKSMSLSPKRNTFCSLTTLDTYATFSSPYHPLSINSPLDSLILYFTTHVNPIGCVRCSCEIRTNKHSLSPMLFRIAINKARFVYIKLMLTANDIYQISGIDPIPSYWSRREMINLLSTKIINLFELRNSPLYSQLILPIQKMDRFLPKDGYISGIRRCSVNPMPKQPTFIERLVDAQRLICKVVSYIDGMFCVIKVFENIFQPNLVILKLYFPKTSSTFISTFTLSELREIEALISIRIKKLADKGRTLFRRAFTPIPFDNSFFGINPSSGVLPSLWEVQVEPQTEDAKVKEKIFVGSTYQQYVDDVMTMFSEQVQPTFKDLKYISSIQTNDDYDSKKKMLTFLYFYTVFYWECYLRNNLEIRKDAKKLENQKLVLDKQISLLREEVCYHSYGNESSIIAISSFLIIRKDRLASRSILIRFEFGRVGFLKKTCFASISIKKALRLSGLNEKSEINKATIRILSQKLSKCFFREIYQKSRIVQIDLFNNTILALTFSENIYERATNSKPILLCRRVFTQNRRRIISYYYIQRIQKIRAEVYDSYSRKYWRRVVWGDSTQTKYWSLVKNALQLNLFRDAGEIIHQLTKNSLLQDYLLREADDKLTK